MKGINVLEKAATEIRIGDDLAFAGGTMGVGKSFSHIDDTVGKTVAKVEGAVDVQMDEVVKHVEKNYKVAGKEIPISESKVDEILRTPKGQRPDPSEYLSQEYIDKHLEQFKDGGSYVMTKNQYDQYVEGAEIIGSPDGAQFISTKNRMQEVELKANGDTYIYEELLGFSQGHFSEGGGMVRIDVKNPENLNLRMATGNEWGANEHWVPGGYTSGGVSEAIVNRIPNNPENIQLKFIDVKGE